MMANRIIKVGRRDFLLATSAASGGLVLGIFGGARWERRRKALPVREQPFAPNLFVAVAPSGVTTIWVAKSEMGQGVRTALPMLVAEELDADWRMVRVEQALAHPDYGDQMTATSSSVRDNWDSLRQAGATARHMLIAAAAQAWQVDAATCRAASGHVIHDSSGRRLSYGSLAVAASTQPVPESPALKSPQQFRLLGRSIARVDVPAKCDGSAQFGLDVRVPGMLFASVERCPFLGGKLLDYTAESAKQIAGVREVVDLGHGIGVVADDTWSAFMGRRALGARWSAAEGPAIDEAFITQQFERAAGIPGVVAREEGGEPAANPQDRVLQATYEVPYLAHATMEPPNCTVRPAGDRCQVWAPTQDPQGVREQVAEVFDLPPHRIDVHTTYLGGGFGRRVMHDEVVQAATLARRVGRPIQVVWTREDDIRHDHYRPRVQHRLSATIDPQRRITGWNQHVLSPSILGMNSEEQLDPLAVDGAQQIPYTVPNLRVQWTSVDLPVPLGFWRSVGHSHTAFAIESFIDEIATAHEIDPVALRLTLLTNAPRHRAVLERVAEAARWGHTPPPGHYQGVALHASFGSYVAQIVEVSLEEPVGFVVHRVTCAVDCGMVVNPDIVQSQISGGIVFGLSAAWKGRVSWSDGSAQQSNFHDYPLVRMGEEPIVDVHVMTSREPPGGVGEVGVPPLAPALLNALHAASGIRVRRLPLLEHPRFGKRSPK